MAEFIDRVLGCVDCSQPFIFTAGEQLFFSEKQFLNDPKRCKKCKTRRIQLSAAVGKVSASSVRLMPRPR